MLEFRHRMKTEKFRVLIEERSGKVVGGWRKAGSPTRSVGGTQSVAFRGVRGTQGPRSSDVSRSS